MSCSPTLSAENWTHGLFTTLLLHSQLSVSSHERLTLTAALTSTLSWISVDASISGTHDALMLQAATRTFNHVAAHPKRCATMRSRTETLSQEGSIPTSELRFRELTLSGLELQMQQLWRSFGTLFESWHHARFYATTSHSDPTPSGTIDPRLLSINTPRSFDSALTEFRNSVNGYVTTCLELVCKKKSLILTLTRILTANPNR